MIDLKILRQQVELGASPQRIVDLVEQMLAEAATSGVLHDIPWQVDLNLPEDSWHLRIYEERCELSLRLLAALLKVAGHD